MTVAKQFASQKTSSGSINMITAATFFKAGSFQFLAFGG
jgi:hypothetical protein